MTELILPVAWRRTISVKQSGLVHTKFHRKDTAGRCCVRLCRAVSELTRQSPGQCHSRCRKCGGAGRAMAKSFRSCRAARTAAGRGFQYR
jgi:hypothetical protein